MKTDLATLPTGYAPTALPFYPDMDAAAFEQFCTDLLNLHPTIFCLREGEITTRQIVSANRLLSGTSQKGADVRAEAERGEVWFFQCKHTKEFGPADVTEAVALAEKSLPHADQFVLVTTCGLREEAQGRLRQRKNWLWWDASNLTTEVLKLRPREEAINLVHRFFGPEWKKALFSSSDQPLLNWKEFFSQDLSSGRQHFHHRIPYVQWSGALAHLESFAQSGAGSALILSAAGGQGKSRLLLELAKTLEEQANAPRVRFLNLNRHGLAPEQFDFLAREEGDLLLIVDDAHRLDAAIQDVARATAAAKSVRLLIATRPQALEAVTSQLFQCGYAERLEAPLCLPRWKSEEIHALAQQILSPQNQLQALRLAALADRCPLLVVMGGTLINSGAWPEAMTSEEAFRERVFRSFKEDLVNRHPENHRARLDRLIKLISFVSPTPKNDKLLNKAAEILGCSALDVADDLDRLQAAGMVVENREGIRLYPDLFADAVLLDASLDHSGRVSALCRTILQKLPSSDFPALMRNLAQADWETRTRRGLQSSLFDPVWTEFTRRFEEGAWGDKYTDFAALILEKYADGNPKNEQADRAELLSQWASFAVYLPEKTLELADLALKTIGVPSSNNTNKALTNARSRISSALPPLLKPIVIWHPEFAVRALDLLWLIDADEPKTNWQNSCNAIAAIANAGSFDVHRPIAVAKTVLEWFECKTQEPATIERFRQQPWILSALLKPFFGREVEHSWSTGRVLHCSSLFVSAEKTRPLRQKALAITKRFLDSGDVRLCNAVIPVISEAIHPLHGRFGSRATKEDHDAWRPDRLEVIKILESAVGNYGEAPTLLLQLRRILWSRCEYDSDEIVRTKCQGVLAKMPDSFELRVARIMTSFAHDEVHVKPGPNFDLDRKDAETKWTEFRKSVASEVVQRFSTARELCEFVRRHVHELATANSSVQGSALLDSIAEISPQWCSWLLEELLGAKDNTLDGCLWSVIHQAATKAPERYQRAIHSLPLEGRPEQLSSLISYFGWKHLHCGGLNGSERQAVLQASKRTEETVGHALASVAGHHFNNDQPFAIEVLKQLVPTSERSADQVLQALARLAEKPNRILTPADVAQCLANVGARCFPESTSDERSLETIAEFFPKQVYEHIRRLHERAEEDPATRHPRGFTETLSLGLFEDQGYVEDEIRGLWGRAIHAEPHTFAQMYPLALIRSLLWSDSTRAADRIRKLVEASDTAKELKLVAELAATRGSRFVFQFSDLVRALLVRGENLNIAAEVRETLWLSACGGGRSFTGHEVDPEYRYILEQSDALANRYADDPALSRFYRMIAESERKNLDWHKRLFADEESD